MTDRRTNRKTNQQTDMRAPREVTLLIKLPINLQITKENTENSQIQDKGCAAAAPEGVGIETPGTEVQCLLKITFFMAFAVCIFPLQQIIN